MQVMKYSYYDDSPAIKKIIKIG
mgnify:CR=1